jgi:hypothetical protein
VEIADLVLKFITVLIWPIVILALCLLFRAQLRDLLKRLQSAKVLGVEAAFESAGRVIADPESTPGEKAVALRIAGDVAQEITVDDSDRKISPIKFEEMVLAALRRVVKSHVVNAHASGADARMDFYIRSNQTDEGLPVEAKVSVRSMRAFADSLRGKGVDRALIVLFRSATLQDGYFEARPGFVFVRWSGPADDERLMVALNRLGVRPA